jgi:hypothetical protein
MLAIAFNVQKWYTLAGIQSSIFVGGAGTQTDESGSQANAHYACADWDRESFSMQPNAFTVPFLQENECDEAMN